MSQEIAHTSQEQEEAMNMIEIVVTGRKVEVTIDHPLTQTDLKETIATIIIALTIVVTVEVMITIAEVTINVRMVVIKEMENVHNMVAEIIKVKEIIAIEVVTITQEVMVQILGNLLGNLKIDQTTIIQTTNIVSVNR